MHGYKKFVWTYYEGDLQRKKQILLGYNILYGGDFNENDNFRNGKLIIAPAGGLCTACRHNNNQQQQ